MGGSPAPLSQHLSFWTLAFGLFLTLYHFGFIILWPLFPLTFFQTWPKMFMLTSECKKSSRAQLLIPTRLFHLTWVLAARGVRSSDTERGILSSPCLLTDVKHSSSQIHSVQQTSNHPSFLGSTQTAVYFLCSATSRQWPVHVERCFMATLVVLWSPSVPYSRFTFFIMQCMNAWAATFRPAE